MYPRVPSASLPDRANSDDSRELFWKNAKPSSNSLGLAHLSRSSLATLAETGWMAHTVAQEQHDKALRVSRPEAHIEKVG
jgi:hypothetical protein